MRTGMLAAELVRRKHSVIWWSSTFSHQRKVLLYDCDTIIEVEPRFTLKLIHAGTYKRNISMRRYRHHQLLARHFHRQAKEMPPPDVLVSAFPIIDLAYETVRYAQANDVPVIVDIRDLWPDIFIEKSPKLLKGLTRRLLVRDFQKTKYLLRGASSLVATSIGYLRWGLGRAERKKVGGDKAFYTGYPDKKKGTHQVSSRVQNLQCAVAGKVVFSFIGSFGHSYELNLICDVARRIAEMRLDKICFVFVGDGQQFKAISRRAKFLPNVMLVGWLDKDEIREVLDLTSVGLVPCISAIDTMPNKTFEYLSAALPILSSLEGEMKQILSENEVGYSYRCGDADTLCAHITKLASDPALRKRLSVNSQNLSTQMFSAKTIYKAYADHVEQIANQYGCRDEERRRDFESEQ